MTVPPVPQAAQAAPLDASKPKRVDQVLWKTTPCTFFREGCCKRGSACSFAHGDKDMRIRPDLTKTTVCTAWLRRRKCKSGDQCKFAHGTSDLRRIEQDANATGRKTGHPKPGQGNLKDQHGADHAMHRRPSNGSTGSEASEKQVAEQFMPPKWLAELPTERRLEPPTALASFPRPHQVPETLLAGQRQERLTFDKTTSPGLLPVVQVQSKLIQMVLESAEQLTLMQLATKMGEHYQAEQPAFIVSHPPGLDRQQPIKL